MLKVTNFNEQMAIGKIHAKSSAFAKRLNFAIDGINRMLEVAPKCYVSLSWGKQSICVAHMVYQIKKDIPMYFLASQETWGLYDYSNVIDTFISRWPINLHIVQTNRLDGAKTWKQARDAGDKDLQVMCPRGEWDGWIWGLASEESPERRMTTLASYRQDTPHPSIYRYHDGKIRCCPLMHWQINDLAAYISTYDIPLLNIYRRYGLTQRTTARVTKKMLRNQGMALCRMTNSKGFRDFVNRFPETNIQ